MAMTASAAVASDFVPVIPTGCGIYAVRGYIRKLRDHYVLRTLENSYSETSFLLDDDLNEVAALYVDKAVDMTGEIQFPIQNYQGALHSTKSEYEIQRVRAPGMPYAARFIRDDIIERVPDPVTIEKDSGFKTIQVSKCR
jgi:hypothetical protein